MDKAIFLDRDGTLNQDFGYVHKTRDLVILPGVTEGLKALQREGYKLIIVTNQSGIGRGYYTKEQYLKFRDFFHKKLSKEGITITAEYFCPHIPEDNCDCRKPKPGMLEQAAKLFNVNLRDCWMIGDSEEDILTGRNAGCRTIQILAEKDKKPIDNADFIAKDLVGAANYILNKDNK
jgi:D,D-heptose 1,7-bisphosphate phosphatase